jgi:hypothetical protein
MIKVYLNLNLWTKSELNLLLLIPEVCTLNSLILVLSHGSHFPCQHQPFTRKRKDNKGINTEVSKKKAKNVDDHGTFSCCIVQNHIMFVILVVKFLRIKCFLGYNVCTIVWSVIVVVPICYCYVSNSYCYVVKILNSCVLKFILLCSKKSCCYIQILWLQNACINESQSTSQHQVNI